MSEPAFLLLGSNLQPEAHLRAALPLLRRLGHVRKISPVYQSPAFGRPDQPDYLNVAVWLETDLGAEELRQGLRQLEAELGRVRSSDAYAARTIDMDLCFLNGVVQAGEGWSLPALHALDRAHVALPLADLDPQFRHPVTGETLASASARVARGAQLTCREDIVLTPPADAGDPA